MRSASGSSAWSIGCAKNCRRRKRQSTQNSLAPEIELTIHRLAKTGERVGSHQGQSVFIEGVIPGERARVRLVPGTKPQRAALVQIIAPSPSPRTAGCPLSDLCGGRGWLHLCQAAQRDAKLEIVLSSREHLAHSGRDGLQVLPRIAP